MPASCKPKNMFPFAKTQEYPNIFLGSTPAKPDVAASKATTASRGAGFHFFITSSYTRISGLTHPESSTQSKPHLPRFLYESLLQGLKRQTLQETKERDRDDFLVGPTLCRTSDLPFHCQFPTGLFVGSVYLKYLGESFLTVEIIPAS
jgi:hypothetical protein